MITSAGMTPRHVRCDTCGSTQYPGASCMPGLPCYTQRNQFAPRCGGTWRTKDELDARERAVAAARDREMIEDTPETEPCPST